MSPNPQENCGPYIPIQDDKNMLKVRTNSDNNFGRSGNHDTIGMIALDKNGYIAAGTSTNGASFKISGLEICCF